MLVTYVLGAGSGNDDVEHSPKGSWAKCDPGGCKGRKISICKKPAKAVGDGGQHLNYRRHSLEFPSAPLRRHFTHNV